MRISDWSSDVCSSDLVDKRIHSLGLHSKLEAAKRAVTDKGAAVQRAQQRVDDSRTVAANDAAGLEAYCHEEDLPEDLPKPVFPMPIAIEDWEAWLASHQGKRALWSKASDTCITDRKFLRPLRPSDRNSVNKGKRW